MNGKKSRRWLYLPMLFISIMKGQYLELYHLRSFVAVAQTGNLTQAAKRLYTTPPALSAHIKSLEDELSTPLFIRSSKGMALTDKGQLLLIKAQATLDSAVDLVNLAATNQHEIIGSFRLGLNTCAEQLKLPTLIDNLQQNCPGIGLDITQQSSGNIIAAIKENQLDGGYIFGELTQSQTDKLAQTHDLLHIKVTEQQITTIAPASFNLPQQPTLTELKAQPWITMTSHCPFDNYLSEKLGATLCATNNSSTIKSSDDNTRLALVKSGLGVSFIEYQQALKSTQGKQIQVISTLDFIAPVYFVIAKTKATEPVIKAMFQEIKILWKLED